MHIFSTLKDRRSNILFMIYVRFLQQFGIKNRHPNQPVFQNRSTVFSFLFTVLLVIIIPKFGMAQSSNIYIHTDRDYYFPGDTVWFKGYFMKDGLFAKDLHNMYMKLIDEKGNELFRSVALINDGVTVSYFKVPKDYKASEIFINANTVLDSSTNSRPYFKKLGILQLAESDKLINQEQSPSGVQSSNFNLSIHPEGGVLLAGLENKVILQGIDGKGHPAFIKGELLDESGMILTEFMSDSVGLAAVDLTIESARKYTVNWTDVRGGNHQSALPASVQGTKVNLIEQDSIVIVQVQTNQASQVVVVSAVIGKRKLFDHELLLQEGKKVNIPLKRTDLEYGILQASLSDNQEKVISQRSLLLGEDKIQITPIVTVSSDFKEKSEGKVSVRLPDGVQVAKLSVSVTDLDVIVDTTQSILTDLYLQPLSKEPMLNPQLFWNHAKQRDLFIQTQNWDYSYQPISDSLFSDPMLIIKGQIKPKDKSWSKFYADYEDEIKKGKKKNIPARGASLGYQTKLQPQMQYSEVMFDKDGKFELPNLVVLDSLDTKFVQIYRKLKFEPFSIKYEFADQRNYNLPTVIFQSDALNSGKKLQNNHELYSQYYTIDARGTRVLQIADVTRTKRSREIERLQNRFKSIEPATVHEPDTILLPLMDSVVIKTSQSLWEYMHRNLRNPSEVKVILNGKEADGWMKVKRIIDEENIRENENPKLDLNEKPEYNFLNEDVSNYPYMKFYSTYNSVVTLKTMKNVLVVFEYSPEEKNRDIGSSEYWETIAGYMPIKSFTNKVYPSAASRLSSGRDNRLTLYWDPLFDFTAQEESKDFIFYNNSSNKGVWLTIQGLTEKGEVIYYRKQITNATSSK